MATMTFSGTLYQAAFEALMRAMKDRNQPVMRTRDNHYTENACKAYIFTAITLESIINEFIWMNASDMSSAKHLVAEIQDLEIRRKYILVPLLFGVETYDKGAQPFQDFEALIRLRNDLVHYRMKDYGEKEGPRHLQRLRDAGVLLAKRPSGERIWLSDVSTFRGALWACRVMHEMKVKFCELFSSHKQAHFMCMLLNSFPPPPDLEEEYAALCSRYPPTKHDSRVGRDEYGETCG